jgi:hypothetical protein
MQELEFPFARSGFDHQLIERRGPFCLVKRSSAAGKRSHSHYEVVRLSIRGPDQLFGRFVPERECYPASEEWGRHGFTFYDLAKARERFEQLARQNACA